MEYLLVLALFCLGDFITYAMAVTQYGPQKALWPGSGYYCLWINHDID